MTFPRCIGCGYCCATAPCVVAQGRLGAHEGPCKALVWDGERHWCSIAQQEPALQEPMAMGAGCTSALNSWRRKPLQDRSRRGTFFHGTFPSAARDIIEYGFDFEAERSSDPGDFGWGVYFSDSFIRARAYGRAVLEVELDLTSFARLPNPYFLRGFDSVAPTTDVERLFYTLAFSGGEMLTVRGSRAEREETSRAIRESFLSLGFLGILTGPDERGEHEVVAFHPAALRWIEPVMNVESHDSETT